LDEAEANHTLFSRHNAQYYNNPTFNSNGLAFSGSPFSAAPAIDRLNSYRIYGESFVAVKLSIAHFSSSTPPRELGKYLDRD
jgi:hypothetical protein